MHILLTNDDGILAPGLAAMYRELLHLGQVSVVAPDSGQSAAAHGITVREPIGVARVHVQGQFHGFAVAGRPADCVKLAIQELLGARPDLVVSGINDGANVSINVLYSGTVAAAADGALFGIPSFAISMEHGDHLNFPRAARIARELISTFLDRGVAGGQLVNINIPSLDTDRPLGVRVAPQSAQTMEDRYVSFQGPDGRMYYWLDGSFGDILESDGDLQALSEGYVVVTPLHCNLTDRRRMPDLSEWEWPDITRLGD